MKFFTNYDDWRTTITCVCRLELTRSYCDQRCKALTDENDPTTLEFIKAYGATYCDTVVSWFRRAGEETAQ